MMGQPKRNPENECLIENCEAGVYCRGLCLQCYNVERWHARRNHGAQYWKEYKRKNERSASRADAFAPTIRKRRGLKAVR